MPDTGTDAMLLENSYDPVQHDDLDNDIQTAGPSDASPPPAPPDASQPPGSADASQHLGPCDASQLPDADHMGPPENFELESLTLDDKNEDTVTSIHFPKLQTTQVFVNLL